MENRLKSSNDLYDICDNYIKDHTHPGKENQANEKIYGLCDNLLRGGGSETERRILLSFFEISD